MNIVASRESSARYTTPPPVRVFETDDEVVSYAIGYTRFHHKSIAIGLTDPLCALRSDLENDLITVLPDTPPPRSVDDNDLRCFHVYASAARRPVFLVATCADVDARSLVSLGAPVVATDLTIDMIPSTNSVLIGKYGIYGDRAGNMAVQNADLIIIIGKIQPHPFFGREAHVVSIGARHDHAHLLLSRLPKDTRFPSTSPEWIARCREWKSRWFVEFPPDISHDNPHVFFSFFYQSFDRHPKVIVVRDDGSEWYRCAYQQCVVQNGDRFLPMPSSCRLKSFLDGITTQKHIFVFLGGRRLLCPDAVKPLFDDHTLSLVCLNDGTETLSMEQYTSRTTSDCAWYPDEVADMCGVPFFSFTTLTLSDMNELTRYPSSRIIEIMCSHDFQSHPRGDRTRPLEIMSPDEDSTRYEMMIAPAVENVV